MGQKGNGYRDYGRLEIKEDLNQRALSSGSSPLLQGLASRPGGLLLFFKIGKPNLVSSFGKRRPHRSHSKNHPIVIYNALVAIILAREFLAMYMEFCCDVTFMCQLSQATVPKHLVKCFFRCSCEGIFSEL
jgi:hypothetical protein